MTDEDKKADVWMPVWIGSYVADTMDLTTIQHGAYFLLLLAYWRKRGPLADSDETLRSIAKMERAEWKRHKPVLAAFFRVGDGVWWHKRVEVELKEAEKRKAAAVSKAKKGAEARWSKCSGNGPSDASSMHGALLDGMPKQCPPPPPLPLPPEDSAPDGAGASAPLDMPVDPVDVIFGLGVPLLVAANVPEKNARSFLGLQRRLAKDDAKVADAIRRCVEEKALAPLEFIAKCIKPVARGGRHQGFDDLDYSEGVNHDGSF